MLRNWKFEIQIDTKSNQAVYLQIADAIIKDIQSGRLKPGDPLPGSRNLAQLLNVNRNTVVEALNVLIIEQWLISKERKGTFVADILPDIEKATRLNQKDFLHKEIVTKQYNLYIDDGVPDSKIAPINELARAYRQIFSLKGKWQMMGYSNELGNTSFRESIAQMLNHQRGMQVSEQSICITRGSQMAMYLTAHCLFEKGDCVLVEDPGYKPAWKAFENAGATLFPIAVDSDGIIVEQVLACLKKNSKIKAIYLTPHRQYPTTVTLSLKRRLELIKLSNQYGFTIIEDDYDNEFHFGYRPMLPLSSFTELKNFVYIGTMSKVVAPALRIGYLTSNNIDLIEKVSNLRKIIDVQGDSIMERAILQLIKEGTIKRHIKKATHHYKSKRDCMVTLLDKYIKDIACYSIPEGGLAFWIVPNKPINWNEFSKVMENKSIKINTPDTYSFDQTVNGIRLGYGSLSENEMETAITAIASAIS